MCQGDFFLYYLNMSNEIIEKYNDETLAAFRETEDIASGKIKPKTYDNLPDAIKDLEATDNN